MYCTYKLTDEKQMKYDNSSNYYQTVKYNKNALSFTIRWMCLLCLAVFLSLLSS